MARAKLLVVDDDDAVRGALGELLASAGYEVTVAGSAEEALDRCREDSFHLALIDLQLPGRNGLALLRVLREACPATSLVLITGHGTIRTAVTALRRGAVEYLTKPLRPRRLLTLCHALTADLPSFVPNQLLLEDRSQAIVFDGMHARSSLMRAVFERVRLAASTDGTVLLLGESGTGKELAARSIHRRSRRAGGPFVTMHSSLRPDEIADRIAEARGGTLFIDEVSTTDEQAQVALLRALDTLRYAEAAGGQPTAGAVRIVAATHHDLPRHVAEGRFREDLFYRLEQLTIRVPPLRERPEDIPILAAELVREASERYHKPPLRLPGDTLRLLTAYGWPGNVRELRNVIDQAVLLARTSALEPALLPQLLHRAPAPDETLRIPIGTPMGAIERQVILRTLAAHEGNKTAAAEALGISRRSIYNKLAEYSDGTSDADDEA